MALHINGLKAKQGLMDLRNIKAKIVVLGSFYEHITFLREREEKREKKARVAIDQVLVGFAPHFFVIFDLGKKP